MIVRKKDGGEVGGANFKALFETRGKDIVLQQGHDEGFSSGTGISLEEIESIEICGVTFVPEQGKK